MPRPPLARERVLDAYQGILISEGERAATLEAVAREAGVSKGGLLYHFASKDDLTAGLVARLGSLTDDDLERMAAADDGPISYYVRTSVMEDDDLDRALIAVTRLAQGGSAAASDALRDVRTRWAEAIRPHVRDETALDLVMLLSDGLYFNNSLAEPGEELNAMSEFVPTGAALEQLVALVVDATTRAPE
ncbi:TetR/AcrR family transcriptional regulator [Microbacterium esteraromaticum]|uniref:TetR/AcrR family transcriptional regulator n=1 Tax=Microbacterium esteraromaticum TaxID=57043 RepID=A0A7D8AMN4_9MICO|nr:TetR/AcrR family transcriptional regulator [Microbacterium esteraromaticum]QMU98008.1 TetR/AcrR family transcriptional regulator [Microbacterium esteraromaticum]